MQSRRDTLNEKSQKQAIVQRTEEGRDTRRQLLLPTNTRTAKQTSRKNESQHAKHTVRTPARHKNNTSHRPQTQNMTHTTLCTAPCSDTKSTQSTQRPSGSPRSSCRHSCQGCRQWSASAPHHGTSPTRPHTIHHTPPSGVPSHQPRRKPIHTPRLSSGLLVAL